MNANEPSPSQLAAIGFAALTIGKVFALIEEQKIELTPEQHNAIAHTVGQGLRERFGDEIVDKAKQMLGTEQEERDAGADEIEAAVSAVYMAIERIEQLVFVPEEAVATAKTQLRTALVEAYDEEGVSAYWQ